MKDSNLLTFHELMRKHKIYLLFHKVNGQTLERDENGRVLHFNLTVNNWFLLTEGYDLKLFNLETKIKLTTANSAPSSKLVTYSLTGKTSLSRVTGTQASI